MWKITLVMVILFVIGYFGVYLVAWFMPKLAINTANSFYFYDKNNELYEGSSTDEWVGLDHISPYLLNATISIEDKHFYDHQGFDYLRIMKSLYVNFLNGEKLQGASTISQQYAKNLFLDFDKTWARKIEEAWLTIRLESHYDKDEILAGYVNTINYGGVFGIENASKYYFGKKAEELNLAEASLLAGIPKWPSEYSPFVNETAAKERQKLILDAMVKNKYVTKEEADSAYQTKLVYATEEENNSSTTIMYYRDAVIEELKTIKSIPTSFLTTGGLKIYTNLDMSAQMAIENSMKADLATDSEIQTAVIAMDPQTGKVLGLAGGRDYSKSQFNRALHAKRQVGSTMKPFLYYAALENGFTPSTTFTSERTTFTFSEDKTYSPKNYGDTYPNKPISLAAAIAYSDNIFAVKTHLFLGEQTLVDLSHRVGITSELEAVPSLALGSEEIGLLEMVQGYAAFANEGYKVDPYFITKVEDMNGNVLYEKKETKENVLNKSITYVLNELLTNTYAQEFVDYNYPTCYGISYKMKHKYAVKTGTTDTDHLIFGYTKDFIVGVWSGYDDNRDTVPTDGTANKNVWIDTMESYLKDRKEEWYTIPNNVVGTLIEPVSGKLATNESAKKRMVYYIKGTEPSYDNSNFDDSIPTVKDVE